MATERNLNCRTTVVVLLVIVLSQAIGAQDLESKLSQKADFTPAPGSAREQLVQVARHYKIPMGVEWIAERTPGRVNSLAENQPTVLNLLKSILRTSPDYSLKIRNGVVHINQTRYAVDSRNFLNLRIPELRLEKANVFDATAELRIQIRFTLKPTFVWVGGYGYGVPDEDGLDRENISWTAKNLTVRQILDRIILSNGNTMWFVDLAPPTMRTKKPFFAQFPADRDRDFFWEIIPFYRSTQKPAQVEPKQ